MKKGILAIVLVTLTLGTAYAVTDLTDEDYEYLDNLHNKLVRMKRHMDRLMKDVITAYPSGGEGILKDLGEDVRVDISQDDNNVIVKADLPGMEKDKIDITLEKNNILRIAGSRETAKRETAPGVVRQERTFGKFSRTVELPCEVISDGIRAAYKDGVLEVVIPKKKNVKEEKIKINVI